MNLSYEEYLLILTFFIIIYLLSKQKKNRDLKKENHILKQYKEAVEESNIISKADLKGNITYVNDKFCEVTLYSREEILGKPHSLLKGESSKEIFKNLWETISSKNTWHGVLKNRRKDGEFYYVNIIIKPILDENNEIIEYIAIRHEITDLIHKSEELEKSLREDFLTKEGNRFKLLEDIKKSKRPSLALLDINRFGEINDFYGYDIGDEVLRIVAKTFRKFIGNKYSLYRIYSDEFAILADNEDKEHFLRFIKQISDSLSLNPLKIKGKEIYIQISYSISFEEKDTLKKTANMIKKYAKTNKDVVIYNKNLEIEKIYEKNIMWTTKLKKAFENDNIVPYYQAIFNIKTNKIEKYEALVRLIDEDGIAISPYYFLDIAKKSKQYLKLTKQVIKKSFEYFKDKNFEFSINLTLEDIKSKSISTYILDMLVEYNIASKVVFEIVESEGIEDFVEVNSFIDKVRELGCQIAIDDFGSGYSNFEYLIKLNADYIKIDGSLIKDILINKNSEEIVITLVDFARRQGLKTIAEFVSNKDIFEKVKDLGIDYAQGYYISEPKIKID
ncbi:GGDEF domain-containing phosphodiesterase [Arcobacter defluvii]|uniref:PAS sensor-containing diguanylate cyclase/phosphodiesterase n=1 Tax=Arcobacter defluvii TaxID=873191 RepID=A0AAE7BGD9_9BACT|nr:GGDEF domain-containing phosphodiesterase [Arcobacter defluvii]QKF78063.1 PAS sensor-containing diguanylate cyclase/phosphodiesterase [Arcobacter defluvii]RXI30007.1 diguanylate cyclase [Arcobacter defluvii]